MAERNHLRRKRAMALISGLIIYICVGYLYSWSNYVTPMEASGLSRTVTSNAFTVNIIVFGIACFLSGVLMKHFKSKTVIRTGAAFMMLGIFGTSFVTGKWGLYFIYSLIGGTGFGLAYTANMSSVQQWFPEKTGTVAGILLTGYGLGGTITGSIAMEIVESADWQTAFKILGISIGAITFFAAQFTAVPKEREAEKLKHTFSKPDISSNLQYSESRGVDYTLIEMLKTRNFWLYFFWTVLIAAMWLGTVSQAAVFALDIGATVKAATFTAGIINFGNGISRLITGYLYDHFDRRKIMMVISTAIVIAAVLFYISLSKRIIHLLIVASVCTGLAYGALATTNPVFIRKFYGSKNYSENFGAINFNTLFTSPLGSMMGAYLVTHYNGYSVMMIYFIVLVVIAFVLQWMIKEPHKVSKQFER